MAHIRPANASDLPVVYDLWYQLEVEGDPDPPAPGPMASGLVYELEAGALLVAEEAGRIIGFAGTVTWEASTSAHEPAQAHTYLGDLFIRRDAQSSGVGWALLEHILPRDGRTLSVMASTDPRALALYVRAGMTPRWPNIWLRTDSARLAPHLATLPGGDLEIIPAQTEDPGLARWDSDLFEYARPRDLAYLVDKRDALPVWFKRAGETIGYGFIQRRSDESLWSPGAYTIGPVGAGSENAARECVCAAVRWVCAQGHAARLAVPAPHPALAPLIEARCLISYVETFLTSHSEPFSDVRRYLPSGVFL